MLFPEEMTELELIVPERDLLVVTRTLAGRGTFQQVDTSNIGSQVGVPATESWRDRAATYALLERQLVVIVQALSMDEGQPPAGQAELLDIASIRPQVEQIEHEVREVTGQLSVNEKRITQLQNQLRELEPIADSGLDLGVLQNPRYIHSTLGVMPVANIERMKTSLSRTPHVLEILSQDRENAVVWLTGTQSNADILDRAARSAFLTPLDVSGEVENGTPSEMITAINNSVKLASAQIDEHKVKITALRQRHEKELRDLVWRVRSSRLLADVMAHYGKLNYTYLIVGWVPSSKREALEAQLKQVSKGIIVDSRISKRTGHGNQNVPIALQNPGILGAFEGLVNTYSRPRYEEIDPTILIAITFPLLYGAMFGDVGHGLVLALIGLLLGRRLLLFLRGDTLLACGLSGMVFGFLYGSVFGFEEILPHHPFFGRFFWISPIHDVLGILQVAIAAGIVLLITAHALNMYNAARARDWGRLFFDSNGLAGLILYLSFLVLLGHVAAGLFTGESFLPEFLLAVGRMGPIVTTAQILFLAGLCLATIFSHPLQHWMHDGHFVVDGGWGMFAVQSAAEVLEKFISMLSNTLSYVRVGAFAIVHAGFTGAVFVIARLAGGGHEAGLGYWAVVVFGNLFVIGLEGFIVTIQTMRLHYYEFFSKFFLGGGSAYEPLALAAAPEK